MVPLPNTMLLIVVDPLTLRMPESNVSPSGLYPKYNELPSPVPAGNIAVGLTHFPSPTVKIADVVSLGATPRDQSEAVDQL